MSSPAAFSGGDGDAGGSNAKVAAVAALSAAPVAAATSVPNTRAGRPPNRHRAPENGCMGAVGDHKKARVQPKGRNGKPPPAPPAPSTSTLRDERQLQTTDEIAASSYAPHMGIFLGHRIVKYFKQDKQNYLGTVIAYHLPWAAALESSPADGGDEDDASENDHAYNDFIASSFRLWKGDEDVGVDDNDAKVGGGDHGGDHQSGSSTGIEKRSKKKSNIKKRKSTKESVESRSKEGCRKARRFGAIPGLYRVLFDDGDVEDVDPTDAYCFSLRYHKMVRSADAIHVQLQRSKHGFGCPVSTP